MALRQINRLVLHHTASSRDNTTLAMVDAWHKARWPNFKSSLGFWVGYHYLIGKDWIKQTRADTEDGAHTYGFNKDSIGVCLTGNFQTESPNNDQLEQLKDLLLRLMLKYNLTESHISFHKDLTPTACPGNNITRELVHNLITPPPEPTPPDKLMMFITELEAVIDKYIDKG